MISAFNSSHRWFRLRTWVESVFREDRYTGLGDELSSRGGDVMYIDLNGIVSAIHFESNVWIDREKI